MKGRMHGRTQTWQGEWEQNQQRWRAWVMHGITHFKRPHGTGKLHVRGACLNSCHAMPNALAPPRSEPLSPWRAPLPALGLLPFTPPSPLPPCPCADKFKAASRPTHVHANGHHIQQQRRAGHGSGECVCSTVQYSVYLKRIVHRRLSRDVIVESMHGVWCDVFHSFISHPHTCMEMCGISTPVWWPLWL